MSANILTETISLFITKNPIEFITATSIIYKAKALKMVCCLFIKK